MKSLLCLTLLLFSISASARTQEAVPLARGNTPGEPHHHLKIENEYVRVYYVKVPPHENTQLHQHDHDYIYVSLGPSDVVNAILNKPEIHLQLKDGETHFTRGGFAHIARNLADTPFRNITIELLRPQGAARNVCGPVILDAGFAICDPDVGARYISLPEFETADVRLDLVFLGPKARHADKSREGACLVVSISDGEIKVIEKGKPEKTLHFGEPAWLSSTTDAHFSNQSRTTAKFLQLIFKEVQNQSPKT